MRHRKYYFVLSFILSIVTKTAFAIGSPSLGDVAANMTSVTGDLAQFAMSLCFIIGFGFGVGAIVKYKSYRDNPQQISLIVPITLFFVALAFLFLGVILYVTGETIFGPGT